jgi:hypothetical protein
MSLTHLGSFLSAHGPDTDGGICAAAPRRKPAGIGSTMAAGGLDMVEVSGFHPDCASLRAGGRLQLGLVGKPQPGMRLETLSAFVKRAVDHENFATSWKRQPDRGTR